MRDSTKLNLVTLAILLFIVLSFGNWRPALAQQKGHPTGISSNRSELDRPYWVGDLLLETDTYQLYASNTGLGWCSTFGTELVLLFKGGEDFIVTNDANYWRRLEQEIFPAISSRCDNLNNVSVKNHIRGFYITDSGNKIVEKADVESFLKNGAKSTFLSFASRVSSRDGTKYIWQGDDISIAWKRNRINGRVSVEEMKKLESESRQNLQRANAADVLALLATSSVKNAPGTYDFTGSDDKDLFHNVYIGNFKPFTDGDQTREDAENFNTATARLQIRLAYVAYHQAFEETCRANSEIAWKEVAFSWRRGFDEQTFKYLVRAPFASAFSRAFIELNEEKALMVRAAIEGTHPRYKKDFRRFLSAEKCSSPAVRHFEVNLYLANESLLPLQVLYQPPKVESQRPASEKPTLDLQKPKPIPQRSKPKTGKQRVRPAPGIN